MVRKIHLSCKRVYEGLYLLFRFRWRSVTLWTKSHLSICTRCFFSALIFAEVEAIPWGQIKTLLSNHMKQWMTHDIFTYDGRLSIGYHYENLVMAEGYNAPGSPYWALKVFLLLATKKNIRIGKPNLNQSIPKRKD